jgi:hypothetical protein
VIVVIVLVVEGMTALVKGAGGSELGVALCTTDVALVEGSFGSKFASRLLQRGCATNAAPVAAAGAAPADANIGKPIVFGVCEGADAAGYCPSRSVDVPNAVRSGVVQRAAVEAEGSKRRCLPS